MKQALCAEAARWMKSDKINRPGYGKHVFAPLTGQDYNAFETFVHGLRLYGFSDMEGQAHALLVMKHAVLAMQPKCRDIARRAIPFQFDWDTHETLWPKIMNATAADVEVAQEEAKRWDVAALDEGKRCIVADDVTPVGLERDRGGRLPVADDFRKGRVI